jgi:hypothetical protein
MNHRLHPPKVQLKILNDGTREDQITWLTWNDLSGIWTDADRANEGLPPATKIETTNAMSDIILRNARGIMDDFMPPPLRDDATPSECRTWLKEACKALGYGFNFENSGVEWENRYGRSFTPEYAAAYSPLSSIKSLRF